MSQKDNTNTFQTQLLHTLFLPCSIVARVRKLSVYNMYLRNDDHQLLRFFKPNDSQKYHFSTFFQEFRNLPLWKGKTSHFVPLDQMSNVLFKH